MKPIPIAYNVTWRHFAEGYLSLAEKGLEYFSKRKNLGKIKPFYSKREFKSRYRGTIEYKPLFDLVEGHTLIATIWNIKHGLELLIKALGISIDGNYWINHNLQDLKQEVGQKIEQLCIKRHWKLFEKLIDKFYNCTFLANGPMSDPENTLFKYPEVYDKQAKTTIRLDYSFVHQLTRKDLNQFQRDIHNLSRLGGMLEAEISSFKSAEKLGISKKDQESTLKKIPTMNINFKSKE